MNVGSLVDVERDRWRGIGPSDFNRMTSAEEECAQRQGKHSGYKLRTPDGGNTRRNARYNRLIR